VFSIEGLFFLRLYWERCPHRREQIRDLVHQGRLRLTGTGITTPDTNIPHGEAILRDYLHGQGWLRREGLNVEPRLAYLPDSFGHSPALPSLLRSLGMDMVGVTRIDGMPFIGSDYRLASEFPLPGSSAEELGKLGAQTFVWRAPDGAEVLCHWNAFTYFQGDMLAHLGVIRWMGVTFGIPWRTRGHVLRRIKGFVKQLAPLARTPYLFCPIGCDFNDPVRDLVALLDRYNREHFDVTGVWAVSAGMDDYLELVGHHRERLPVVEMDPNPVWMGAYASRPEIKRRCNSVTRKLLLAEKLACARMLESEDVDDGVHAGLRDELSRSWDVLAVSNHHDFITGTSPDRVWHAEQRPWLQAVEERASAVIDRVMRDWAPSAVSRPPVSHVAPLEWRMNDGELTVSSAHLTMVLSERQGGCIVSLCKGTDGPELLAGPSNDVVAYHDEGGLWRMGHEFRGGRFEETMRASAGRARIEARERGGVLEIEVRSGSLSGDTPLVRRLWVRADSPIIRMQLAGAAPLRRTLTCLFHPAFRAEELVMDVPGGVLTRPRRKIYDPTFWPARSFAHIVDAEGRGGLAALLGGPACVSLRQSGAVEWVVLRNAPREQAFGLLPLPAHPASGTDPDQQEVDYAVWLTDAGSFVEHRLFAVAERVLSDAWLEPDAEELSRHADAFVALDRHDVLLAALKPADHGGGLVARLFSYAPQGSRVKLSCGVRPIKAATLCDARERDLSPLELEGGAAMVTLDGALTSVRLLF
jgi:hypothetical protein